MRLSNRWFAIGLSLTVGVLGIAAVPASAATSLSWTTASIASGESLDQISCPSAGLCVAVGGAGDVFTSTAPSASSSAWTRTFIDNASGSADSLNSITCPSTTLCVAVDDSGFIFTTNKSDPCRGER